jgi:diadenylate cyclase
VNVLDDLALLRPGWLDLFEILLVAAILYRVFLLVQRTRAMQILLGLFVLGGIYLVAQLFGLDLIRYLLETVFQYGVILALVVFQPELRSALARIGQSRMVRIFTTLQESEVADEIADAVERLSRSKIGAIIAVEQEVGLDEYAETGSPVEARVSADMITTIFTPYSPLHDGAILVRGDQIRCAGAILPLTQYSPTDKSLGTRHRAALGLSEETDAIVVVVSEESARVSVARGGRMERDVAPERLREILTGAARKATPALSAKSA